MEQTRRQFVGGAAGSILLGGMAGCLDDAGDGVQASGTSTAQSTFFVFGDLVSHVTGDVATSQTLVPVGQHGHGWEPGPSVRQDIRDADLLVHGMEGFQPWVDDILTDLEADQAAVQTLEVSREVDLLGTDGHDEDGHEDGEDGEHENGEHEGGEDQDGDHSDGEHEDGDHGTADPHFWMDPLRTKTAVDTAREALTAIDAENETEYAANAEAFKDSLDDLHERTQATVSDAETEVLLVAGHNSFQYIADRYDITVQALTGITPDERPTTRDIERAQGIIDDHDIQYVCADPLEPQEAAEQLVAETDAEAVLPLTAMPGLTEEWRDDNWGYVEIMENVNLPTLERALDAQ